MNEWVSAIAINDQRKLKLYLSYRFGRMKKSFSNGLGIIKLLIEDCVTQYRVAKSLFSGVMSLKQLHIVNSPNFSDIFWSNDAYVLPLMRSLNSCWWNYGNDNVHRRYNRYFYIHCS
ncbi:hypothetical protein HELRODRAFT_182994 [Helobdella robusta]|uniref:Uncharacterized protein n=1 Tax=Helobdella robusta TaxID=6412 RepID=T1FJ25_HELRO|nr:hypothetical protein HELRODRAFT_182994 [Helobdella robusta]ESN89983.1 hypothetical protein HELRODRAFT_182994 [Helobdella robusta]